VPNLLDEVPSDYQITDNSLSENPISDDTMNDDVFTGIFTEPLSKDVPSRDLVGDVDTNTNYEWLEFPTGSGNNWYRTDDGGWMIYKNN
jgi:hypothetical protein